MRILSLTFTLLAAAGLAASQNTTTTADQCMTACGEWAATQHRNQTAQCGSVGPAQPQCFCQTTAMMYGIQECMLNNCPDFATNLLEQCKTIHAALRVGSAGFATVDSGSRVLLPLAVVLVGAAML